MFFREEGEKGEAMTGEGGGGRGMGGEGGHGRRRGGGDRQHII